jgi:cell division protein FtsA
MICGLDLGSSKIKVLLVEQNKDGNLELLEKIEKDSEGIRRGIVINKERVSNILSEIFDQLSLTTKKKISSVYTALNGSHIFLVSSRGLVSVSRADQKITEDDIQRVVQAAQSVNLQPNREVFDFFVKEFSIDGQIKTKEPIGLKGVRLEAEVLILTAFSPYLERQKKCILDAGLEISDIIAAPLASARSVLTQKQKELGAGVIDIGAGTTGLAVFEEESLIHLTILPVGSINLTNDIAIGLKIDPDLAETIKKEYGTCVLKGKDERIKVNLSDGTTLTFSKKFLTKIINARMSEIFDQINQELKKVGKEKGLPGGLVLCGGGAKLNNILDLAKEKFHLPVKIAKPQGILGLEDDPSLALVSGLVLLGADFEAEAKKPISQRFWSKIKKFLKIFIP